MPCFLAEVGVAQINFGVSFAAALIFLLLWLLPRGESARPGTHGIELVPIGVAVRAAVSRDHHPEVCWSWFVMIFWWGTLAMVYSSWGGSIFGEDNFLSQMISDVGNGLMLLAAVTLYLGRRRPLPSSINWDLPKLGDVRRIIAIVTILVIIWGFIFWRLHNHGRPMPPPGAPHPDELAKYWEDHATWIASLNTTNMRALRWIAVAPSVLLSCIAIVSFGLNLGGHRLRFARSHPSGLEPGRPLPSLLRTYVFVCFLLYAIAQVPGYALAFAEWGDDIATQLNLAQGTWVHVPFWTLAIGKLAVASSMLIVFMCWVIEVREHLSGVSRSPRIRSIITTNLVAAALSVLGAWYSGLAPQAPAPSPPASESATDQTSPPPASATDQTESDETPPQDG